MPPETSIEARLAALEAAVEELRQRVALPPNPNWLNRLIGSQCDEPAFDEFVALGREFRATGVVAVVLG